jgi:CheY-like chemotaxis protein
VTATRSGKVILIVEDSELIRHAFGILLEESGYRVLEAANGREALDAAEAELPDLILMDMGLPDMAGLSVTHKLQANPATRDARIVALTGRALDTDEAACRAAGCIGYLVKPVQAEELLKQIAQLV